MNILNSILSILGLLHTSTVLYSPTTEISTSSKEIKTSLSPEFISTTFDKVNTAELKHIKITTVSIPGDISHSSEKSPVTREAINPTSRPTGKTPVTGGTAEPTSRPTGKTPVTGGTAEPTSRPTGKTPVTGGTAEPTSHPTGKTPVTGGTTEGPNPTKSPSKKLSPGAIAGIVIAVILLVVVLIAVVVMVMKRRAQSDDRRPLTA